MDARVVVDTPSIKKILFVAQLEKRYGFGHLKRSLSVMQELARHEWVESWLYLDINSVEDALKGVVAEHIGLSRCVGILDRSQQWSLIVVDMCESSLALARELMYLAPVVALDEGGVARNLYPYLIDLLPRVTKQAITSKANESQLGYLNLPKMGSKSHPHAEGLRILLSFGGSDQARMTEVMGNFLEQIRFPSKQWSVVKGPLFDRPLAWPGVKIWESVQVADLLDDYDIIFTHFGITAYEALAVGCKPILLNPTKAHQDLAVQEGFFALGEKILSKTTMQKLKDILFAPDTNAAWQAISTPTASLERASLAERIVELAEYRPSCPVCGEQEREVSEIFYRTHRKSYAQCAKCQMIYLMYFAPQPIHYDKHYFEEEYRSQYGKSYLEDFEHIKTLAQQRLGRIERYGRMILAKTKLLDIGCAYGPFLQAASEAGCSVYGTDVAEDAIDYVVNTLNLSARVAEFPTQLAYEHERFDLVSMWYVIEHFSDLDNVMVQINKYLNMGGIFVFATPKADGLSAQMNLDAFLEASPDDHYTLFRQKGLKNFLKKYGFALSHVEVTGVHVQRKHKNITAGSATEGWMRRSYKYRGMGDTFEVYAVKKQDLSSD
jgi:2-polyprenyl-3-methyl-5-hydroxy-6-metoxy-1,4-benzoquinol methylase/spore coat polysaccharide biosynthesis predicted glycosyltransferase SpsG